MPLQDTCHEQWPSHFVHSHSASAAWQAPVLLYYMLLQDAPFFTVKLQVKMLPCLVFFQNGVACDRAVGFDDYGASDDFSTTAVERRLLKSGEMHPQPQSCIMGCSCTQALLLLLQ